MDLHHVAQRIAEVPQNDANARVQIAAVDASVRFAERAARAAYGKDSKRLVTALQSLFKDEPNVTIDGEGSQRSNGDGVDLQVDDQGRVTVVRGFPEVVADDFDDMLSLVRDPDYFDERWNHVVDTMYDVRPGAHDYYVWFKPLDDDSEDTEQDRTGEENKASFPDMTPEEMEHQLERLRTHFRILRVQPPLLKAAKQGSMTDLSTKIRMDLRRVAQRIAEVPQNMETISDALRKEVLQVLRNQIDGMGSWTLEAAGDEKVRLEGDDLVVRSEDDEIVARVQIVAVPV